MAVAQRVGAGNLTWDLSLQEQQVLLTSEPSSLLKKIITKLSKIKRK